MPKFVMKEAQIVVNGVDLSDHCASVGVMTKKDGVDTTNFGGAGREQVHGLSSDEFEMELQQDFDAAEVDATLWPLYSNETEFTVAVRPKQGAISATNPEYSATCILLEYTPLTGAPGDLSKVSVTFPAQRSGIARATS